MASELVIEEYDDDEDILLLISKNLTNIPISYANDTIKIINLSDNKIVNGRNLMEFKNLNTLILDKNQLANLDHFPKIVTLETLWINNNNFENLDQLLDSINNLFPNLRYLSMLKNPCCPDVYFSDGLPTEAYPQYRKVVTSKLTKLLSLDATDIQESRDTISSLKSTSSNNSDQYANLAILPDNSRRVKPASYLGKGRMKYDGRQSEGNRFIGNSDL